MNALSEAELDLVASGGVVVVDDAVEPARLAQWLASARALDDAGGLTPGDTGARRGQGGGAAVRGDRTAFVGGEGSDEPDGWTNVAAWFDALGGSLARGLRLGLPAFSVQLAVYPPGTGYQAHRDALAGDPSRQLTAIVYLDRGFGGGDGGALRIERDGGALRIAPLGGRLVVFRSDIVVHAVEPALRARWALTAWFGRTGQRRAAARSPSVEMTDITSPTS